MRAQTNWVNTSIDHYPECDCDGTCPKCAEKMAGELLSVLAVLNCCQYGKDPYQLELREGGVAELVAKAIWGEPMSDRQDNTEGPQRKFAEGGFIEGPPEQITIDLTRERIITQAEVRTWSARANPGAVRRRTSSDAILARLSPGEAMIPGPNGPIHIRGSYGDQPAQVTEINPDDIEEERT